MHVLWVESPSGGVVCVMVKRACAMSKVPMWWCYLCNGKTCLDNGKSPHVVVLFV